ncbi:DUF1642 domain-containing protein [Listeria monocytogenes]|nr:DUF1642 domain-containing protein [Listeria monocytogenes]EIM2090933.1 DUF1642 domain-containing protein [Listeria monocytogenes]EIM2258551.1 DUF1642 domain-containing protein [Listeria monocytogenes]MDD85963.1 DUF1642 domain-containing protein [Listeria monocytogenes]
MKFREGDKVEFVWLGKLTQGVVTEIRENNHGISYQIEHGEKGETILITRKGLIAPAPVLKVPQFVADWISHCKQKVYDLFLSMDYEDSDMSYEMYNWLTLSDENQEIFARAWLDGYEVEKEPLYYVKLIDHTTGYLNVYYDNAKVVGSNDGANGYKTQFTESEIKSMDKGEAYWLLREPVEEVTK